MMPNSLGYFVFSDNPKRRARAAQLAKDINSFANAFKNEQTRQYALMGLR